MEKGTRLCDVLFPNKSYDYIKVIILIEIHPPDDTSAANWRSNYTCLPQAGTLLCFRYF
ncbi:MAG: hypothetical protein KJN64_04420 [Ignavibacteria bacterium]|nr:hypothetical protein [Ignavibacteria bacterium]